MGNRCTIGNGCLQGGALTPAIDHCLDTEHPTMSGHLLLTLLRSDANQ
jgi:hypothetical protein